MAPVRRGRAPARLPDGPRSFDAQSDPVKDSKVTGGLTRLTTRKSRKSAADDGALTGRGGNKNSQVAGSLSSWADVWIATQYHLAGLNEQLELERKQRQQAVQDAEQFNRLNWKRVEETELLRVRGLWGPSQESWVLTKWMMDMTEGPCRMRKKLTANPHFYAFYPYRPELELAENKSLRYKVATSLDAKEHFKLFSKWRQSLLLSDEENAKTDQDPIKQLALTAGGGGSDDREQLETMTTQLQQDLPQLLRPKSTSTTMADIDEDGYRHYHYPFHIAGWRVHY